MATNKTNKLSGNYNEIDLVGLFNALIDKWKIIVTITCITSLLGILYIIFATPIYKADALVQVEQKVANSLLN